MDGVQQAGVAVVGLPAGPGDVPAVDHELVEGDDAGHLARQVEAPCLRHPRPCLRVAPRLGQGIQVVGNPTAPVVTQS